MKDRPILFFAAMVRALLAGTKTQTRRPLGIQPLDILPMMGEHLGREWVALMTRDPEPKGQVLRCRLGAPGDRLWVKETFYAWGRWETRFSATKGRDEWHFVDMTLECGLAYQYAADSPRPQPLGGKRSGGITPNWWKRPAIFMPRAASRITLEVTGVRVERLQDINGHDAAAEGVATWAPGALSPEGQTADPEDQYRWLWEGINGPGSWDANPWVWVIDFQRVTP